MQPSDVLRGVSAVDRAFDASIELDDDADVDVPKCNVWMSISADNDAILPLRFRVALLVEDIILS
jgi:hypothetical protein